MPEWFVKRDNETEDQWWHRVNGIGPGRDCECHPEGYSAGRSQTHG